jgi:hypothetical protein
MLARLLALVTAPCTAPWSSPPSSATRAWNVGQDSPFSRSVWTHVAITHSGLGSADGHATLYVDGVLQGSTPPIMEPFTLDPTLATIRLWVSYAGLLDDLALFNRELSDEEIPALYQLDDGAGALHV